jgi:3-hydroxyisobutyrate dehydrogenase
MVNLINSSSGLSGSTDNKFPNFVLPGTYDSGFGIRLMVKDMRIAVDLAP